MTNTLPLSDRALQPGEADLLGRGAFVRNLAIILSNAPKGDSVVFALYGKWGEGKTSTLTLLDAVFATRKANGEASPVVIRFNPWVFSGREHLFNAFFEDIGNAIGTSDVPDPEDTAKKWKRLGAYSQLAGTALGGINAALSIGGIAIPFADMIGDGLKKMGEITGTATDAVGNAHVKSLTELRGEMEEVLKGLENPLLVVLDDLDRLPPGELVEIFQLLKSTVDLPNIHYLLLCDRGNVERNLDKQGLSSDYLEKIVQFSAPLPAIPDSLLHELLMTQLQSIFKQFAGNDSRINDDLWTRVESGALPEMFATLRDVKRFVGEFRMTLPIFCNGGYFELNPEHFLKLQALRLFCPSVVDLIRSRRKLFMKVGRGFLFREDNDGQIANEKTAFIEEEIPKFLEQQKSSRFLPLIRELLLTHGVDISSKELAAEQRFLASRLWFDVYFTLEMPQKYVSVADVSDLRQKLAGPQADLTQFVDKVIQACGEVAFVRCLENQFREEIVEHGQALICAILSATPSDDTTNIGSDGPWFPFHEYFARWLRLTPERDRKAKLLDLLDTSRNHIYFAALLYDAKQANGQSSELLRNIMPFDDDLGKATARIIQDKAAQGTTLLQDGYWYAQDAWENWGNKNGLRSWIRNIIQTDDGFSSYLRALGGFKTSHDGTGDEEEYFWINHNRLAHFPSLKDGIKRCQDLRAKATAPQDILLYEWSEAAFRDQAELRRGLRIIPRRFPKQLQLRLHNPKFVNGINERMALITVTNPQGKYLSQDENEKIERRFADFLDKDHRLATKISVGPADGSELITGFLIPIDEEHASQLAREWGQASFFMVFNQNDTFLVGCNGEGRLPLGNYRKLVIEGTNPTSK
jgi:hypothetical protein